ncbi:MAG: hypothetical protein JKY67_11870 [Pseudomonadales bacterium]|nr:hypothetical protein [Pseudomonadales bacterium]
MHVNIDYPDIEAERKILQLVRSENQLLIESTLESSFNSNQNKSNPNNSTQNKSNPNKSNPDNSKQANTKKQAPPTKVSQEHIFQARKQVLDIYMLPALEEYIIQLVMATRTPGDYGDLLVNSIEYGVSPRGTIALDRCARAHAWLNNRDYVTPEDIQIVAPDTLRHRIGLSFEAEAKGVTCNQIVGEILDQVAAP